MTTLVAGDGAVRTTRRSAGRGWGAAVAMTLVAAVPLVVQALTDLGGFGWRSPVWTDYAALESDVRAALDGDLLVGGFSRLGVRNLGPAHAFWTAPWYVLAGEGAGGMVLAAWIAHAVALGVVLAVVRYVLGVRAAWIAAVVLALAWLRAGPAALSDFYNPTMTVPAVLVTTVAAAGVALGRWRMLWLAVLGASFGTQIHFAAAPGLLLIVAVAVLWGWRAGPRPGRKHVVAAVAVGAVLWVPTVVDQAAGTHNLGRLREAVAKGPETEEQFFGRPGLSAPRLERARVAAEIVTLTGSEPSYPVTMRGTAWGGREPTIPRTILAVVVLAGAVAAAWILRRRAMFGSIVLTFALVGATTTFLQTATLTRGSFSYYLAPLVGYGIIAWVGVTLIVVEQRWSPPTDDARPIARPAAVVGVAAVLVGLSVVAARPVVATTLRDGEASIAAVDRLVRDVTSVLPAACAHDGVAIEAPRERVTDVWQIIVAFDKLGLPATVAPDMARTIRPGASWTGHEAAWITLPAWGWPDPSTPGGGVVVRDCTGSSASEG